MDEVIPQGDLTMTATVNNTLNVVQNVFHQGVQGEGSGEKLALQAAILAGQASEHASTTREVLAPMVGQCTALLNNLDERLRAISRVENNTDQYLQILHNGLREALGQVANLQEYVNKMGQKLLNDIGVTSTSSEEKVAGVLSHINEMAKENIETKNAHLARIVDL